MVTAKAPGKLYLAGEYAVTLPGQPSIIFAVDRFVTATLTIHDNDDAIQLISDTLGQKSLIIADLPTQQLTDDWRLVIRTLQVIQTLLAEQTHKLVGFTLTIKSELTFNEHKLGLGSSAAVVAAIIRTFHEQYHLPLSDLALFKLGVLITMTTPNFKAGSMGDLATAISGGLIMYQRFADDIITTWLSKPTTITDLITQPWPLLKIKSITLPANWQILIGWTGTPADTQQLLAVGHPINRAQAKQQLADASRPVIEKMAFAINTQNYPLFVDALTANQQQLITYTEKLGINYQTADLEKLRILAHKQGGVAKISGAGGGDNGIAMTNNPAVATAIKQAWQAQGIVPLPLSIAYHKEI